MAVKAYVGRMRSGKSYEVVSQVILPALRAGFRVVSNVAGLNYELMREMLIADGADPDKIGQLVVVSHADVEKPNFWRTDTDPDDYETVIQLGDLVVLDEVWRFWKKRGDISPRALNFIRMHGHMPHPVTGYICQVVVISQVVTDINENVRGVVEETYRMTKMTSLGMDKRYRVDIFQGGSVAKKDLLRTLPMRTYEAKYFPLYKSYSKGVEGAHVEEKNVDSRGNILKNRMFVFGIPIGLVLLIWANWTVYKFFSTPPAVKGAPSSAAPGSAAPAPVVVSRPPESEWRVVGYFQGNNALWVMLERAGQTRRERAAGFQLEPFRMAGNVDGLPAGQWTGVKPSSSGPGGAVGESLKGGFR